VTEAEALSAWARHFPSRPGSCQRFQQGLCNYSFLIEAEGKRFVLKMAEKANEAFLRGTIYWLEKLGSLDLPVSRILVADFQCQTPFLILDYLEGADLGLVYQSLSEDQKRAIVQELVRCQNEVAKLGKGPGFGHVASYEDPARKATWSQVVHNHLARSRTRMEQNGYFDPELVARVESLLPPWEEYFATIEPVPFFDDTTTKNLLVHQGRLSGIIDLDWLCFGDRIFVIALTRMSLLNLGFNLSYIDYWVEEEGLDQTQLRVLDLYTLMFCLDFMGEKGMRFNKEPAPVSQEECAALLGHFRSLFPRNSPADA